ncbi:hypothetical protein BU15DRAFT_88232 [Melanogaster broomeanus]|nr:hypothetical protein BU15DRAFT_88232 [Melanogaster broomeanus]
MSRLDSLDLTRPPGLGHSRSAIDLDHTNTVYPYSTTSDRRTLHGLATYPANSAISANSRYGMQVQEKESNDPPSATDCWTAVSNRHTSAFNNPQLQHPSSKHRSSLPLLSGTTPAVHAASSSYYSASSDGRPPRPGTSNSNLLLSTLCWGDLEPWMDEEYAKQVCGLMGWDPVCVKVPNGGSDNSGQQANNPGYCFLTFPSPSVAASVLSQVTGNSGAQPVTMPNSNKPFLLNWASSIPSTVTSSFPPPGVVAPTTQQQYPKEYSIFVGDLAPETSNSDLVAVFRNPVLGLRNDREPKFIRPFLSCKSAKIMLDPVTGVSRGYGFVRFSDEADQQRALIEMHGLYCLSRPMRISPATAKFKPTHVPLDLPLVQFPGSSHGGDPRNQSVTVTIPLSNGNQTRSVSSPMASSGSGGSHSLNSTGTPVGPSGSASSLCNSGSNSVPSLSSGSSTSASSNALTCASSDDVLGLTPNVQSQVTEQYGGTSSKGNNNTGISSITSGFAQDSHEGALPRYMIAEESWKHHAQVRAILGNLMGPNGEQLTSTDPYNTTVFVGGLSPLISEETLRTFFAPFGEIHYVKVPVGKHCGFVQFVRKADAERAIEKLQGFPIGGSRIRLSWGRSQYKAAQAAAQAAQAAAAQAQFQAQLQAQLASTQLPSEQALQLLQKLSAHGDGHVLPMTGHSESGGNVLAEDKLRSCMTNRPRSEAMNGQVLYDPYSGPYAAHSSMGPETIDQNQHLGYQLHSSFSPFSPDPNSLMLERLRRGSEDLYVVNPLSQTMNPYPARFDTTVLDRKTSLSDRPNGPYLDNSSRSSRSASRQEPISRPNSSGTSSQRLSSHRSSHERDPIHDLNGTLASLNLDHQSPWRPTGEPTERRAPS